MMISKFITHTGNDAKQDLLWNTFPKVSMLTAWISWHIASLSCSIVRGVFFVPFASVAIRYPESNAHAPFYIGICGLPGRPHKRHDFRKKKSDEYEMCL